MIRSGGGCLVRSVRSVGLPYDVEACRRAWAQAGGSNVLEVDMRASELSKGIQRRGDQQNRYKEDQAHSKDPLTHDIDVRRRGEFEVHGSGGKEVDARAVDCANAGIGESVSGLRSVGTREISKHALLRSATSAFAKDNGHERRVSEA